MIIIRRRPAFAVTKPIIIKEKNYNKNNDNINNNDN